MKERVNLNRKTETGAVLLFCENGEELEAEGRRIKLFSAEVSFSRKAEPLVSVGEDKAFAVALSDALYTVTVSGVNVRELLKLDGFEMKLGERIYRDCHVKSFSGNKAVIVSAAAETAGGV